jgi:hypothetical protein
MLTAAVLTGMAKGHSSLSGRHHHAAIRPSSDRVELGDTRIPVRSIGRREVRRVNVPPRTRTTRATSIDETSPDIIVGYVGPRSTNAFHRLTKVEKGDRVKVIRRDGRVAWFEVDSVRRALRRSLREDRMRNMTGRPELRLISRPGIRQGGRKEPGDVVVSAHLMPGTTPARTPVSTPASTPDDAVDR